MAPLTPHNAGWLLRLVNSAHRSYKHCMLHGCIAIQNAHCVVTDASDNALGILDCNAAAQHAVLV